jgi:hypothetical protein
VKIKQRKVRQKKQPKPPVLKLPISGATRRLGRGLLDQQMWCFGCDIRRPAGNLLLQYGFTRHRPPEGETGGSCYILYPQPGCQIGLWGNGLFYGEVQLGGLFLKRYEFSPKLTGSPQLPAVNSQTVELPAGRKPQTEAEIERTCALLGRALSWVGRYEQWVQAVAGVDYRRQSVRAWHRKTVVPAGETAAAWQELAEQFTPGDISTLSV